VLFPAYNGLCQSKPLCLTVYNTCQIAIQVKNIKRNANDKLILAVVNDDDKTVSELVGFTNLKGADQDAFIFKDDIRAGTYKLIPFSMHTPKPSTSKIDPSRIGRGKFLSNEAKASLAEIFKLFDLDADGHLSKSEYALFHRITLENQTLTDREWDDLLRKCVTKNNRLTRDAFLALHQGYLQEDPSLVADNLTACGLEADRFKLNSSKLMVSVTSNDSNVKLEYYHDQQKQLQTVYDRDLAVWLGTSSLTRPIQNLPADICQGSDMIRLAITPLLSDILVTAKNLNKDLKAKVGLGLTGSRNIKWRACHEDKMINAADSLGSSRVLGTASVLELHDPIDFIMQLTLCKTFSLN